MSSQSLPDLLFEIACRCPFVMAAVALLALFFTPPAASAQAPRVPLPVAAAPPVSPPQVIAVNSPDGKPLSQRVVAYWLDARLNTADKTLDATEILEYRNLSDKPLLAIPFHLYLNAFQPQSTFTRESHASGAGGGIQFSSDSLYRHGDEGAIEIRSISAAGYGDLTPAMKFIAPDDGNPNDRTVAEVTLPQPVAPGATIHFQIAFHDKFPPSVARNGYKRDFIMGGQWFPKIGVFSKGEWNCHQYHADTEFFSDFGTYNVMLRVPDRYIVGASGIPTGEISNHDGTKTLSFRGEDIHDFAWAASPNFVATDDTFTNRLGTVKLHVLALASHAGQSQRFLSALKAGMQKFDEWYGPYPYKQITLIDPEPGSNVGGMEYPTLFTGESEWWEPAYDYYLEQAIIHEFGHQYWYGMVATNEVEEPWLDEGINTYSEVKVTDSLYGQNTSLLNARNLYASNTDLQKMTYLLLPDADPIARQGWNFLSDLSYGAIPYGKTSTLLSTLEGLLGQQTLRHVMQVYFLRYRFTHPTGADFLKTLLEVSGRQDLGPFLAQAIYGTDVLDYAVDSLVTEPAAWWKGSEAGPYRTSVVVRRKGTLLFPARLEVGFADGSSETADWDGKDRWARYSWEKPSRAIYARLDKDDNVALDVNTFNNSYILKAHPTARWKLTNYWMFTQQLFAQWLSFLV